ncbi:MAG: hypothetical protein Q8P24_02695, partial [Desulfobacterales bacterium]|nr:hypothetical protein [Desulfobacterales bacterium]
EQAEANNVDALYNLADMYRYGLVVEKDLGKALRPKEVADYLGVDDKTIIKYYKELGGMRLGSRYIFFERRIIDAIQKRTTVDSPGAEGWTTAEQSVPDQEGGKGLGSRNEAKASKRVEREDRHDMLD